MTTGVLVSWLAVCLIEPLAVSFFFKKTYFLLLNVSLQIFKDILVFQTICSHKEIIRVRQGNKEQLRNKWTNLRLDHSLYDPRHVLPSDKNQKQKTENFGLISKELTGYTVEQRHPLILSSLITKKKLHECSHDMNQNIVLSFNLLSKILLFSCCCVYSPRETRTSIYSPHIRNQLQMKEMTT